jgi:hypothetical protein
MITAGAQGVNVRSGPGVNFAVLGRLEPGVQAQVVGRYSNWWQILYNGNPAWVSGDVVTAANVEAVPQVQPPPSPVPPTAVPPTAAPTAVPPTVSSTRGLTSGSFIVSNKTRSTRSQAGTVYAPGPYALNTPLWCDWQVSNGSVTTISYSSLGPWVEEANYHKKSWTNTTLQPGNTFGLNWEDHIEIGTAGTYKIWLRICFTDGVCANLAGPVSVTIQ